MARVLITGFGLVTPLGHGAWETFRALLAGRTLADRGGELPADIGSVELVRALGCVSVAQHAGSDPAVELAERAAREALTMANADPRGMTTLIGTSKGAVAALVRTADHFATAQARRNVSTEHASALAMPVVLGPAGYMTDQLQRRLELGPTRHLIAACASSLTALDEARRILGRAAMVGAGGDGTRRALVVTADAALLPLFIHAYRRLGVLAPLARDDYRSRPMDEKRCGFMLAEAGAAVLLECIDDGDDAPPHAIELVDTAVACDGHDLIRTPPGMPALSRVAETLLRDRAIDLLHPHAPGTVDNDPAELAACGRALTASKHQAPDVYAVKGALGHSLGAAGLVSLVIACLCARTGRRPPMPWLTQPIASPLLLNAGHTPAKQAATPRPIQTQAVFAAGFGGHVAGAVIRTV